MQAYKSITTNLWVLFPHHAHNLIPLPKSSQKRIDAYSSTTNPNPETSCKESDCICEKNKNRHLCLKMKPLDFNAVSFDAVC